MKQRGSCVIDTSVMLEILAVPGHCSDREAVLAKLDALTEKRVELFVPVAALVETGKHVQRLADGRVRREQAVRFREVVLMTVLGEFPWSFMDLLWSREFVTAVFSEASGHPLDFVESITSSYLGTADLVILREAMVLQERLDPAVMRVCLWTKEVALDAAAHVQLGVTPDDFL